MRCLWHWLAATRQAVRSQKFEDNLWKYAKDQARFLQGSAAAVSSSSTTTSSYSEAPATLGRDTREYKNDDVEGYTRWNSLVKGILTLERQKGGKNQIIFKSSEDSSKTIVLPATTIAEAKMIIRKTGRAKGDLLIQLDCKDASGKSLHPIFNINDDIARGVLAGIKESVGEDKLLREFQNVSVWTSTKYCSSCGSPLTAESVSLG